MSITVSVAATNKRLTTLTSVKAELGITVSTYDTLLTGMIEHASAGVARYCNREFAKETIVEGLRGFGRPFLMLSRTPILTITSVEYGDDPDNLVTMPATDYHLEDSASGMLKSRRGVWQDTASVGAGALDHPVPGSEVEYYFVTYQGGYVTPDVSGTRDLPYEVERACIDWVKALYMARQRDPEIQSESVPDVGAITYRKSDEFTPLPAPPSSMGWLSPWRRYL